MPCGYSMSQSAAISAILSPFPVLIQKQSHRMNFWNALDNNTVYTVQLPFGAQQQAHTQHKHKGNDQQWVIIRPSKLPYLNVIFDSKILNSVLFRKTWRDKKIADGQF